MRAQMTLPQAVSGWCFWASILTLVVVIGLVMAGAGLGAARVEGVAQVLMRAVQFGFAAVVGLFLVGIACSRVESRRR